MSEIIGIEEHWMLPELRVALDALPSGSADPSLVLNDMGDNGDRLNDLDDLRLETMQAQGVDRHLLSLAPPAAQALIGKDAVHLTRAANDRAADAVRRRPTQFGALAALPLAEPEAAVEELRRARAIGHVGVMVYGRSRDLALDDPRLDDVFATAAELRMPIFIHPQVPSLQTREASYAGFSPDVELALATFGWGWHLEAALAALRLIARGTLDRHPDLQIVLGHWGELLPFWSDRTDSLARVAGLDRRVSEYLATNFHFTISGMLSPSLLRHTLELTTVDRLMFSTDYPFQRPSSTDISSFAAEFSPTERAAFLGGNAKALFQAGEGVNP